jgi:uracil-DNA glycosylase
MVSTSLAQPYMQEMKEWIKTERETKIIYPDPSQVLRALELTPYEDVKVVIVGQDPYHNGYADGLAFSSNSPLPPSVLQIIFKEINRSLYDYKGADNFRHADLSWWARQGVLLLNTVLTVEKGKPMSHANIGWKRFYKVALITLSSHPRKLVFMFWGKQAQQLPKFIDLSKHHMLTAAHPAAELYRQNSGFIGCDHFKTTNDILISQGEKPIDWSII